jgi:transcriptional regulator with GAF, ATPase, and Fis domain
MIRLSLNVTPAPAGADLYILIKEAEMEKHAMYYDTIVKLTTAISQCKDPEEVALITAESVKTAFSAKGCSVFLVNRETRELGLVASSGLSDEYLNKGPIHFMQTIQEAKDAVPIAIFDVMDDPRIEYPEHAKKEGIASLLGVPIISNNKIIGALRVYTAEPWEFSHHDINSGPGRGPDLRHGHGHVPHVQGVQNQHRDPQEHAGRGQLQIPQMDPL